MLRVRPCSVLRPTCVRRHATWCRRRRMRQDRSREGVNTAGQNGLRSPTHQCVSWLNSSITTKIFLHILMFPLSPEVFGRRIKTSFFHPVFGTVSNRCAKKIVLHLTELVAALLMVHSSLSLLVDVDRLLDPSGGSVWFPVYQRCVTPLYHMVFL